MYLARASLLLAVLGIVAVPVAETSSNYSLKTAESMLALSRIAYCTDLSKVKNWSCKLCPEFPGMTNVTVISDEDYGAQLFVGVRDGDVFLSFRGTETLENMILDLEFATSAPFDGSHCKNCSVHIGFLDTWNSVRNETTQAVVGKLQANPGAALRVTGHSLGASVAEIACLDIGYHVEGIICNSLYTFGAPRTGNPAFVQAVESQVPDDRWRVTHWKDPIPHLPPVYDSYYLHSKTEIFYDYAFTTMKQCVAKGWGEDPSCSYQFDVADCIACCVGEHLVYLNQSLGQSYCDSE